MAEVLSETTGAPTGGATAEGMFCCALGGVVVATMDGTKTGAFTLGTKLGAFTFSEAAASLEVIA